jgi:HSP20 family protein
MRYTLGNPVHLHHAHPTLTPPLGLGLRQIMDRLVESAFVAPPVPAGNDGGVSSPALNAYDEGDYLVVEAQVPGMKPEDIDVSIEQGMLTIQGKPHAEQEHVERTYLSHEYQVGSFNRSVQLPETVDSDGVTATYEHGVLRLTLPKAAQTKIQHIRITPGDQTSVNGAQVTEPAGTSGASGPSS